jgi:phosphoglycerate kinase
MELPLITDLSLKNKRVLIREDFNVPIAQGCIQSKPRILAALPTIQMALRQDAAIILLSHLGRPIPGSYQPEWSLAPVAACLQHHLARPIRFIRDWLKGFPIQSGEIVLCENVRMQPGEQSNDPELARQIAALCDIFVMDAFAVAHRTAASTVGVTNYVPHACAGLLLAQELKTLSQALHRAERPIIAIIGGSKVSTKLQLLTSLIHRVDYLILGGGIANTFLAAQQYPIGKSLYEPTLLKTAQHLLAQAHAKNCQILLPETVKVATALNTTSSPITKTIQEIGREEQIFDIGTETAKYYAKYISQANTILWNGPVGVFEQPAFAEGTQIIAHAVANSPAFSIAGGGDTIAAIEQASITNKISYISTGGGAFLAFLEGKPLPAVQALQKHALNNKRNV